MESIPVVDLCLFDETFALLLRIALQDMLESGYVPYCSRLCEKANIIIFRVASKIACKWLNTAARVYNLHLFARELEIK
jgi:hypothetical protein